MADTIKGDDGLLADVVQPWAKDKHDHLCEYISISSATRRKYLKGWARSAIFIDLFCGTGRARIKETGEWIDGSAVAAWQTSVKKKVPFSKIYVADINKKRREAAVKRLRKLEAPVEEVPGSAVEAVEKIVGKVNEDGADGLHLAFIDPYSLGALDFKIIQSLAKIKKIDMMLHVSKMDLQRNLEINLISDDSALDKFAPGWRDEVSLSQSKRRLRIAIMDYWKKLIVSTNKKASVDWKLITGKQRQHLYWLTLVASHELPHRFWKQVAKKKQGELSL